MPRGPIPLNTGTRVFTGARCIFKFNDSIVGYASGVSGSREIMYEPVETLDALEVREHAPVGYRVTLSAQMFRTIAVGVSTDFDAPGSLVEQNIMPKFDDILRVQGVDALCMDKVSGKIIALFQNVKTASENFNITARAIVGENVQFVTTKMFDEGEIPAI